MTSTDPTGGTGAWTVTNVDGSKDLTGISCASASLCVAVDGIGDIISSATPDGDAGAWTTLAQTITSGYGDLNGVSCPTTSECIATEFYGVVTTINPSANSPTWTSKPLQTPAWIQALSCPTVTFCAGYDVQGDIVATTTPAGDASEWATTPGVDAPSSLSGISCVSSAFCAAIDKGGDVLTATDPTSGTPLWTPAKIDASGLSSISCPSASLCVASDGAGNLLTSTNPTGGPTAWVTTAGVDPGVMSCAPGTTFCVGVIGGDAVISSNPTGGATAWSSTTIDAGHSLVGVSCPTTGFCATIDAGGVVTSTDPTGGSTAWSRTTLGGFGVLENISCPSAGLCATTEGAPASSVLVSEDPTGGAGTWSTTSIVDYEYDLDALSCGSNTLCVAADDVGDVIAGTAAPTSEPPVNAGPPAVSGATTVGQTLTESHGSWSNSPDLNGFSYQWEDCDSAGNNCSAVSGATSQTYVLTASDVGHTIRVQETASNAGGAGSPASSAATGVVAVASSPATKPSDSSPPEISGTTTVGQVLSTSTGAWSGTPPISYSYQWERCTSSCSAIGGAMSTSYTLTSADVGAKIAVVVTATNTAGSAQAVSSEVGSVAAQASGPSSAQIRAALANVLKPSGKKATTRAIVKAGGYSFSFTAPSAGKLVIDWFATVKGKQVLVASASVRFNQAGKTTVKLKLTSKGRKLLKNGKSAKITTTATFTPTGGTPTSTTTAFTLKP